MDGLAIAAMVVGILSIFMFPIVLLPLAGLVLSIIALRRVKREGVGGRGLALTGLVTSIVGLLFFAGALAAVLVVVRSVDHVALREVEVGDCVNDGDNSDLLVAPCLVPHEAEVYGVVTEGLPADAPTGQELDPLFDVVCRPRFQGYIGVPYDQSEYASSILTTPANEWESGSRVAVCIVHNEDGTQLIGSIRNGGR